MSAQSKLFRPKISAWDEGIGSHARFRRSWGFDARMVERGDRGHSYPAVRGEILGFAGDERVRKRLPRALSLIKNESRGIEDDQIPS